MKKKILSLIMMLFLAFTITLTGCAEKGLDNNPPLEAMVTSNGGTSVIKGDYLYFVNGYVETDNLNKNDNKAGQVTKGAIYRTKLDDNEIVKDKDGFLLNDRTDIVVSKVVGFNKGGFYIIDNSIIYATPYMKLSQSGEKQTSRVEFHRVDIDGTDDEVLFVTSGTLTEWTVNKVGKTPYIVLYENDKLVSINVNTGKTVGTVNNTTSYQILKETEYNYNAKRTSLTQTKVIYTRAITSADQKFNYSGNVICAFDIATGKTEVLEISETNTYSIKNVTSDAIYYTYTSTNKPTECLYKKVISDTEWKYATEVQLTTRSFDSYIFVDYGNDLIIATGDSTVWRLEGGKEGSLDVLLSTEKTILRVFGNYAYYADDNKLFRVNINDDVHEIENVYPEDKPSYLAFSNLIDFDNRRIFLYSSYISEEDGDTNYYLNYFDESCTEDNFKQRFVGVFESGDLPEKPEQPEPEYEGDEVEYVPHID